MKRITLGQKEVKDFKEILEGEKQVFYDFAKTSLANKNYGAVAENMGKARGLEIALERLETQLNK